MAQRHSPLHEQDPSHVAIDVARHERGGRTTAVVSALALLFSGYSLWDSSLKAPSIKVFVPPVIQYSSPYNNSNFEMIAVPVTLINDGGRTGTVLSMTLEASSAKHPTPKRFYAADFGRWTMEKTRASAYEPFAPISLTGKASRTETVLFYTDGPDQKPEQLITEPGKYSFKLTLDEAQSSDVLDKLMTSAPASVAFESELRYFDARAFNTGTLPLYSTSGKSVSSDAAAAK